MKAFVVMPYGGKDSDLIKHYNQVFRFLIKDAVNIVDSQAEVIRQDHTHEGGGIIRNVISNIADSDIVIADLSGANWNVAYELGMRHVMAKYGTVLICDDETELPYDIQHLNIIMYSRQNWLNEIDNTSENIVNAIQQALKRQRTDSPVFDVYTALPEKLTEMLNNDNDAEQHRLMELAEQINQLKDENDQLREKLENAGLDNTNIRGGGQNLTALFHSAVKNRIYNSDDAVKRLRELQEENEYEKFADFLAEVLEKGYLDEQDCLKVYQVCRKVNIPEITMMYLEQVVQFYPDNDELKVFLANAYSQNYHQRDKALAIVNESLGIRRKDGHYELTNKVRSKRMIGAMFDVYSHLKKYADSIAIGKLLLEDDQRNTCMICYNIANNAFHIMDIEMAKVYIDRAIEVDPTSDMAHYTLSRYYSEQGNHIDEAKVVEKCIALDPEDADYPIILAGIVCDDLVARDHETGEMRHITHQECEKYAMPYLLYALLDDPVENGQRVLEFMKRNKFSDSFKLVYGMLKNGHIDKEVLFSQYNMSMVDYCLSLK